MFPARDEVQRIAFALDILPERIDKVLFLLLLPLFRLLPSPPRLMIVEIVVLESSLPLQREKGQEGKEAIPSEQTQE